MSTASPPNYFVMSSSDGLLIRSVLNEVLNGFPVDDVEGAIGLPQSELEKLFEYLSTHHDDAPVRLTRVQARAAYNALGETLRELGIEEFHTRTGFDFAESESVLKELGQFLHATE